MWLIRRRKKENMNLYVNQHIIRGIYEVEGNKNLVSLIPEEFPFFVCHLYNMWGKYLTVYCFVQLVSTLLVLVLFCLWFCCCFYVVLYCCCFCCRSSSRWHRTRKMKTFFQFHLKGSKTSSWYAFAYFLFLWIDVENKVSTQFI